MSAPLKLKQLLPKGSKLEEFLNNCEISHELHLHELHDGALTMVCYHCPFHHVLSLAEEDIVRGQMIEQGIE